MIGEKTRKGWSSPKLGLVKIIKGVEKISHYGMKWFPRLYRENCTSVIGFPLGLRGMVSCPSRYRLFGGNNQIRRPLDNLQFQWVCAYELSSLWKLGIVDGHLCHDCLLPPQHTRTITFGYEWCLKMVVIDCFSVRPRAWIILAGGRSGDVCYLNGFIQVFSSLHDVKTSQNEKGST